eukprot:14169619-Alexandrium_andersonii.AAC.1
MLPAAPQSASHSMAAHLPPLDGSRAVQRDVTPSFWSAVAGVASGRHVVIRAGDAPPPDATGLADGAGGQLTGRSRQ